MCDKLRNVHKFENIGHSDLIPFVYLGLVQMHISINYKTFMNNHKGRRGRYRKKEHDLICHVHRGHCEHMCKIWSICDQTARRSIHRQ